MPTLQWLRDLAPDCSSFRPRTTDDAWEDAFNPKWPQVEPGLTSRKLAAVPFSVAMGGWFGFRTRGLFSLPSELLAIVAQELTPEDLASLALCSVECRQLARTEQFKVWYYTGGPPDLLKVLVREAVDRTGGHLARQPPLGACVRHIHITQRWWDALHDLRNFGHEEAYKMHVSYYGVLQHLLRECFPNLETLTWADGSHLTTKLVRSIIEAPARHLQLRRFRLPQEAMTDFRNNPLSLPSLVTLDMHILYEMPWEAPEGAPDLKWSTYGAAALMMESCAETLQTLRWNGSGEQRGRKAVSVPIPKMKSLRRLELEDVRIKTATDVDALVPRESTLMHLGLDGVDLSSHFGNFLASRGRLPTLKSIVLVERLGHREGAFSFLTSNPQLEIIGVSETKPADMAKLASLLPHFRLLRSLHVGYDQGNDIFDDDTLQKIAQIQSLEYLHLSASSALQNLTKLPDWHVDHKAVRKHCIRNLPNLRTLAFTGDTYRVPGFEDDERYYMNATPLDFADPGEEHLLWIRNCHILRDPRPPIEDLEKIIVCTWEMAHRRRMLMEANKYAKMRLPLKEPRGPALEYLVIGQLPIKLHFSWWGHARAMTLTEGRLEYDVLSNALSKILKGQKDVFGA